MSWDTQVETQLVGGKVHRRIKPKTFLDDKDHTHVETPWIRIDKLTGIKFDRFVAARLGVFLCKCGWAGFSIEGEFCHCNNCGTYYLVRQPWLNFLVTENPLEVYHLELRESIWDDLE